MKDPNMSLRSLLTRLVCALSILLVLSAQIPAQTDSRNTASTNEGGASTPAKTTPINPTYTTPKSANDTAYGAKIAEYTTEKYFMTELVDHLPLSSKVPSPEKVLGYA